MNTKPPHFINIDVPNHKSCIGNRIKSKFDKTYDWKLYQSGDDYGNPKMYKQLYRDIVSDDDLKNKQLVLMSSDSANVSSVITALSYKHHYTDGIESKIIYKSDLKIIYVDSCVDLDTKIDRTYVGFNSSVVSNALTQIIPSFTNHDINLNSDQLTYIGVQMDSITDKEKILLNQTDFTVYSLELLRKKGLDRIIDEVVRDCNRIDSPTLICVDLSVLKSSCTPSAYRRNYNNKDGLDTNEYDTIIKKLSNIKNKVGLCITGYDFNVIEKDIEIKQYADNLTTEIIKETLRKLTSIKEKSVNVFNEESFFLIYRWDDDEGYGWNILRNADLAFRDKYINERLPNDEIYHEMIDGRKMLITKTTINDQKMKFYDEEREKAFIEKNITSQEEKCTEGSPNEKILYSGDKVDMYFELVNAPIMDKDGNATQKSSFEL